MIRIKKKCELSWFCIRKYIQIRLGDDDREMINAAILYIHKYVYMYVKLVLDIFF